MCKWDNLQNSDYPIPTLLYYPIPFKMKYLISAFLLVATFAALFHYCSPSGINKTGHEYMPDMVHPVSYEAGVYSAYRWNHWENESAFTSRELSQPRGKVAGSIPRGQTAMAYGQNMGYSVSARNNGDAPFYYKNDVTEAGKGERERCSAEITANPVPVSAAGLERGKVLYDTYCGLCHGKTGNGQGYLVSEENPEAKYPAAPANFLKDEFLGATEGRYYYAIMYGKNLMGSYADKLSYEERWEVMHHIRSLQAAATNSEYSAGANTFVMVQLDKAAKWAAEQRAAKVAVPK